MFFSNYIYTGKFIRIILLMAEGAMFLINLFLYLLFFRLGNFVKALGMHEKKKKNKNKSNSVKVYIQENKK